MNRRNNMRTRIYLRHNLPSVMFSIYLFLFALEPALENIKLYYILLVLCGAIWLVTFIISIITHKQYFILNFAAKTKLSFFDVVSALIGLVISYSLNSNLFKLWIFLLVINIVAILMPNPYKR